MKIKCPSARVFLLLLPKAATKRQHFFMRHCFDCFVLANLIFFSVGVELISVVFVSGLQELDQLYMDLYLFFLGFSHVGSCSVFSRLLNIVNSSALKVGVQVSF